MAHLHGACSTVCSTSRGFKIDGISGTSAGAMNAAVLVDGHAKGGAEGARTALENFWRRVSEAARFSPLQRGPLDVLLGRWTLDHFTSVCSDGSDVPGCFRPTTLNPMGYNPLREILVETIDFERLAQAPIEALHHRYQCSNRPRSRVQEQRNHAGCSARLGLSARLCFRPLRLTANLIGTAAIPAIRRSRPWCRNANHMTPFSFRSIRVERERSPRSAPEILTG